MLKIEGTVNMIDDHWFTVEKIDEMTLRSVNTDTGKMCTPICCSEQKKRL